MSNLADVLASPWLTKEEEIDMWLQHYGVINYTIHKDLSVSTVSPINIYKTELTHLPLQFNQTSHFYIAHNKLISLKGVPKSCKDFNASSNQLTSLEFAPLKVNGRFTIADNKITSLKYLPPEVLGSFDLDNNLLTSLEGSSLHVKGGFNCSGNQLASLQGGPQKVDGNFVCSSNPLTSFVGGPVSVGSHYGANFCPITSLEGFATQMPLTERLYCHQAPIKELLLYKQGQRVIAVSYEELLLAREYYELNTKVLHTTPEVKKHSHKI